MNGNPARVEIAQAQMYFAVMTRKAELMSHSSVPVVGAVAIARAYDRMTPAIADLWVQQCELQPVGYSVNADTGKLSSMYLMADVETAFSHARRTKTRIGLRPYSGEWHAGGIPKKVIPPSTKERHQKARAELAARRAEEEEAHQKRLDDWDKEHGILPN